MKLIFKIKDILKGKKAYILGTLFVILGIAESNPEWFLEGFTVIALRAGMSKGFKGLK